MKNKILVLKAWKTRAGYQATVINSGLSHKRWNCGYVSIPKKHPLYRKPYSDDTIESLNVHGGITYSEISKDYPIKTKNPVYWLGFDCAHADDTLETCDLNYCIKECENLAKQLKKLDVKK